ncbi:MAG: ABC transporter ATP-binding protein, partial [Thalassospira sp.]|nr:ABC transporter ATP-binding protein [Thalassospira sp.]
APLRRAVEQLEKQMEKLSTRKMQIEAHLGDPDIYDDKNARLLADMQKELGQLKSDLTKIEADWMARQEEYEAMVA